MSSAARTRTDPRISRRRRAVARARKRSLIVRICALLAFATLVWALFFSPLLAVRKVKVVGAEHTSGADIAVAADLDASDNLLLLSTGDVAAAAATLPWVASVEVDRMLPGTVRVKVVERQPAIVLSLGAARWTLDREGRVLQAGAVEEGLPVLGGLEVGSLEAGSTLDTPEAAAALATFRSLPRSLEGRVRAIFAPTPERISFSLTDNTLVRYGSATRLRAKNRVLLAVLARLDQEGRVAAYIDVRVPTNPAVASQPPAPVATASPAPAEADQEAQEDPSATQEDQEPAEAEEPADGYEP